MSASHPAREVTLGAPSLTHAPPPAAVPPCTRGRQPHRSAPSAFVTSVISTVDSCGKWTQWRAAEPRLDGFASLEEARERWRRRDPRCYLVVAGLTALGSRRGGDDDDAALAVAVMLEEGVNRVAITLHDVCELVDVNATVWEEVKAAEPNLGTHAARYLLQRARQRLTRPAAGMVPRVRATSLDQRLGWHAPATTSGEAHFGEGQDRDLLLVVPEVEDPVEDLADLLAWAKEIGVIAVEEIDLLVELLAAENEGMAREEAQRAVGERHGVAMRTIRRRRDRTAARLRAAAPQYLAALA